MCVVVSVSLFFFNDTATTEIYTLSLHDALPIWSSPTSTTTGRSSPRATRCRSGGVWKRPDELDAVLPGRSLDLLRSEEHTSELQSRQYLVCRLLLEKKKTQQMHTEECPTTHGKP